jgi:hypothetical protein
MAKPMIVLIKRFTYRGNPEEYSNQYHFTETPPASPAGWKTLVDALAAQEKTLYVSDTKIVRAYCYEDADHDATTTVDYTALAAEIPGTYVQGTNILCPGDCATWIRWSTAKKSSKGKAVYLRKYFHNALVSGSGPNDDAIVAALKTPMLAFGNKVRDGSLTGFTMCGPDGTAAGTPVVANWVTTRTLKRRGKRPSS